ncbi:hypothetical protein [Pseudorhodoferax sp. Leaf274]|uniref:hypothetical protein n=1 Tax=Pseudorhodoferax sp. Leaf274 TaxID=1736318 RepID=UPI0012E112E6|nr:hypothetical protein [Pseudorhodoferax sp. Leaf274]
MTKRLWTAEEDARLRAMYTTATVKQIAELLNRTEMSIRIRAWEQGLRKHHKPACNWKPIGSERMDRGILIRKVTDTGRDKKDWKRVDVIEWEAKNGPIPPGYSLMLKDGNGPRTQDNLALFTKSEHFKRASVHAMPPEIAALYQLKGQITQAINRRTRTEQQAPSEPSDDT